MTGLSMVLVLLLGQAPDRGAGELVRQLGSSRYDEREAAAAALEKMGLDALPALRDGRESKDLGVAEPLRGAHRQDPGARAGPRGGGRRAGSAGPS